MPDVSPETKAEIRKAYEEFEASLRRIAHEHRVTVSELLHQVDEGYVKKLKERIEKEGSQ